MTATRNWLLQRVIRCDVPNCTASAPVWKALLPGSGWKVTPRAKGLGVHTCPDCPVSTYYPMGSK